MRVSGGVVVVVARFHYVDRDCLFANGSQLCKFLLTGFFGAAPDGVFLASGANTGIIIFWDATQLL